MDFAHNELPQLTTEAAIDLLRVHSYTCDDYKDPRMEIGFLGSLRPFRGSLNSDAFHEVMACVKTLGPSFSSAPTVLRQPISNLWGICFYARDWAVDPNGMLRRNNLINDEDVCTIEQWLDCIAYAVMVFLEADDAREAFAQYNQYMDDLSTDQSS